MKLEYLGREHDVNKNVNIVLNEHRKQMLGGELFCEQCQCVWPCPTRIVLMGYGQLLQEKMKDE